MIEGPRDPSHQWVQPDLPDQEGLPDREGLLPAPDEELDRDDDFSPFCAGRGIDVTFVTACITHSDTDGFTRLSARDSPKFFSRITSCSDDDG